MYRLIAKYSTIIFTALAIVAVLLEWIRAKNGCETVVISDLPACLFFSMYLMIFVIVAFFSILIIKNGYIFGKWFQFTIAYLTLYSIIYLIAPSQGDFLSLFYKEGVAFISLILYAIISIVYILILKRKEKK